MKKKIKKKERKKKIRCRTFWFDVQLQYEFR